MNLRAIANSHTRAINPNAIGAKHRMSVGYEIVAGGKQKPKYEEKPITDLQIQSLKSERLFHLNLVNQQGMYCTFLANNLVSSQVRSMHKGEDYLIFRPANEALEVEWKVVKIEGSYDDGSLQDGSGWVRGIIWRGNPV